ncbi:MAG: calcium/sodium antiporter [Candidatus Gracilibacteria bacterium]|nr:calcium/sodium antiporter [Candidatus Gracilibacteria bacterium]
MDYILLLVGFFVLIKCASYLVDGSTNIAKKYGISNLVIGLTIIAFGTSAPEIFINTISAIKSETGLALGNIIGSNIANILLILGISSIIYPLKAQNSTVFKEAPYSLLTSLALFFLANDIVLSHSNINVITFGDSSILFIFFVIFMSYTFGIMKNIGEDQEEHSHRLTTIKSIVYIVGGTIGLALGAEVIVRAAKSIAFSFGVSETVIGLTIIAIGTSLPELATSIAASLRKENDIVVGNIIGSNIINIVLGLSLTGFINPILISPSDIIYIYFELTVTTLLLMFLYMSTNKGKLNRWHGIIFLIFYVIYLVYVGAKSIT